MEELPFLWRNLEELKDIHPRYMWFIISFLIDFVEEVEELSPVKSEEKK